MQTVYVYGTLRTGNPDAVLTQIPGDIYDLGWFPGLVLKGTDYPGKVVVERLEVTDEKLRDLDSYEGYRESDPENSLYLRVPYLDGWVYTYNASMKESQRIKSGDWFKHTEKE